MKAMTLAALVATAFVFAARAGDLSADPPAAVAAVVAAKKAAGTDLTSPLYLCGIPGDDALARTKRENAWLPPAKIFDNLYFIGSGFVGLYVLKTSDGLILFDSGTSIEVAREKIVPDMVKLGLDPKQIKYIFVTHGHWDHFGGAPYFQDTYGARIGLAAPDWHILEKAPPDDDGTENQPVPRRDIVVTDGRTITLGDTAITLLVIPSHTPGTIGALIPVKEGGKTYVMSLFGGTAFPPIRGSNNRTGGLVKYRASVVRMRDLVKKNGAVGAISPHPTVNGSVDGFAALQAGGASPNPFLWGTEKVDRYYEVIQHCLDAAIARPENFDRQWSHAFPD